MIYHQLLSTTTWFSRAVRHVRTSSLTISLQTASPPSTLKFLKDKSLHCKCHSMHSSPKVKGCRVGSRIFHLKWSYQCLKIFRKFVHKNNRDLLGVGRDSTSLNAVVIDLPCKNVRYLLKTFIFKFYRP